MTRYTTTDVLICGAGVTGLTLAIELARHGVSFRLIEKRTTPFIGSRGKGIQPRTQEIFEDLGILNKVVAAGGLYPRLRTYRHDGSYVDSDIAHHTKPTHAEPYHLPLMVPQNVTETIMREQLKAWGHRVEFGCELRHFAQTPHTVTAYVAGPAGEEVIIAHYLIGADGGGSFVRKNEVLIKVDAAGICGSDIGAFRGTNPLVTYPRIIGHEVTGIVLQEGARMPDNIKKGDRVIVDPYIYCGHCYPCSVGRTNCCENLNVMRSLMQLKNLIAIRSAT